MRRLVYIPFVLVFLMQAGCTLSMEEYIVPEEDRGQGELYTQQEEFGTISYQFKDSVLSVTDNIQEKYLVRVEADSILYFSDQIPQQWRPYVGMKLASHITHALPWGLNHKVIAVENLGGILKVTATKVSTDEVYEHLKFTFDAGVPIPDFNEITLDELEDYGYEMMTDPVTGDTVIMDWNDYDVAKGKRPAGAKRKSLKRYMQRTRGEDDDIDESDEMANKGVAERVFCDQFWDTRDMDGLEEMGGCMANVWYGLGILMTQSANAARYNLAKGKLADWTPYIGLGLKIVDYQRAHIEEDKDRKYEYKYVDSWTTYTIKAEAGVAVSPVFKRSWESKSTYGNSRQMLDQMDKLRMYGADLLTKNNGMKIGTRATWDHFKIRFPLGYICGIPVAIVAGASWTPILEIDGSCSMSVTYTSDKIRSHHKVENGEKKDWDEILEPGSLTNCEALGNASIKVGVSGRVYAGIEVGCSVGVTLGLNGEAIASGDVNISVQVLEGGSAYSNISGSAKFQMRWYLDVQLFVAPLGMDVWSHALWTGDSHWLVDERLQIGPNVGSTTSNVTFGYLLDYMGVEDDATGFVGATVWTRKMDVMADFLLSRYKYYPGMKIYFGPIEDGHWEYMMPQRSQIGDEVQYGWEPLPDMGDWKTVEGDKSYSFMWEGNLDDVAKKYKTGQIDYVYMVPIFYTYKNGYDPRNEFPWDAFENITPDHMITMEEKATWQYVAKPYIYTALTGQVSYKDMGMCEQGSVLGQGDNTWVMAKNIYRYSFYVTVDVMGGNRMKGWGLDLKMYDPWKKRYKSSHKKFKVDTNRSGRYTFLFTFDTDWQANKSLIGEKGEEVINQIYYTVVPYWEDPHASNALMYADDKESNAKHPIVSDSKKFLQDDKEWLKYIAKHPETYGKDLEFFTITEAY